MKNRLKQFRVEAGLTQAQVAAAVGVSQPNYQRWESGFAPIPPAQLKKLAKALSANTDTILGRHPPIKVGFYDPAVGDDLDYYGEVAIHFHGPGEPLLLSISEGEFDRLHAALQGDAPFVTIESLANQTVAVRTSAVSDIYFSSEAFDTYGPEHGKYSRHVELLLPDSRDWEIVEALALDSDTDEFQVADVERVRSMIMITDEQYRRLVNDGMIEPQNLEAERERDSQKTEAIFSMATETAYQLSNGVRRSVFVNDQKNLYEAFYAIVEYENGFIDDGMIRLEAEGKDRIVFINGRAIDYVSIPTHQFQNGRVESNAEAIDSAI